MVLTLILASVDTVLTFPDISVKDMIVRSGQVTAIIYKYCVINIVNIMCQAWQNGIMFSIVDSYIYGNMIYTILSVWVLPSWIMFHLNITTNTISDNSRLLFDKKVQ